ncbi:MAG: glucose-6-phosphate dehydrogenase [Cyanobacteriota bacterium]
MSRQNIFCTEVTSPPCGIIIFGASGDLTSRKLLPALFSLYNRKLLNENFFILGCSRTDYSSEEFKNKVYDTIKKSAKITSEDILNSFVDHCFYISGDYFGSNLYEKLSIKLNELENSFKTSHNRIFYCATPPNIYLEIICSLGKASLNKPFDNNSWSRIIVEKPFGSDINTSMDLDRRLLSTLKEEQIYRIDLYLGKETVQNILMLRFANSIFEPLWNSNYIDHIQVLVSETIGIGHRAGYFEKAGLLRDMCQNHMLQLLTLIAMEPPAVYDANKVRDEKIKLLSSIRSFDQDNICNNFVRGQYVSGIVENQDVLAYRNEKNVNHDSNIETFTAFKLFIDNWRWRGVPFYFRVGKRLKQTLTGVAVVFKSVPHSMFDRDSSNAADKNILFLTVQPKEGISLKILAKYPGPKSCLTPVNLNFCYKDEFKIDLPEAYERLLLDCMHGDQTLFIRHDFMKLSWNLMSPVLNEWAKPDSKCPLYDYKAGSWGPEAANKLIENDGRKWLITKLE